MTSEPSHDATRAKLLAMLPKQPSPTRKDRRIRNVLLSFSSVAVPLAIWWSYGGVRIEQRPLWWVIGTSAGWLAVAAWAVWGSLAPGPTMLGRTRRWQQWIVILTPTTLFVWMLAWDLTDPARLVPWEGRWGQKCLNLTMLLGAWPLLALIWMRRGSEPLHPGARGAAIGAAVGCSSGVLVDLWCPITDPSHMLLGHILPLAILSFAGLMLGRWLLGLHARRKIRAKNEDPESAP